MNRSRQRGRSDAIHPLAAAERSAEEGVGAATAAKLRACQKLEKPRDAAEAPRNQARDHVQLSKVNQKIK